MVGLHVGLFSTDTVAMTNTKKEPGTIHVVSLGCSKAQVDAEAGIGHLVRAGWRLVDTAAGADLVVVNTCSFIEPAIRESIDTVVELGGLKEQGDIGELVVSGCLVDRFGEELAADLPEVDRFLGSGAFRQWAGGDGARRILASPGPALPSAADERVLLNAGHFAYVKIAEGCDRACTFCTIPQIRGRQVSRSADDIVAELRALAVRGVREGVLISQDTIRWGRDRGDGSTLGDLLARLEDEPDLPPWIRLHYLYPEPGAVRLAPALAAGRRIVPYVDVPIQHASDDVLRLMARGHRADDARRLLDALRSANPDVSVRTTVIAGFPGETPADVDALIRFIEEAGFEAVGVFTWWDEESAPAHTLPGKLDEEERYRRAAAIEEAAREAAEAAIARRVGRTLSVLVDGRDPASGAWIGRHPGQAPDVDGIIEIQAFAGPAGNFLNVDVVAARGYDLIGKPAGELASPIRIL
jgi:ribosomal protein S12 methylthiotransferase